MDMSSNEQGGGKLFNTQYISHFNVKTDALVGHVYILYLYQQCRLQA